MAATVSPTRRAGAAAATPVAPSAAASRSVGMHEPWGRRLALGATAGAGAGAEAGAGLHASSSVSSESATRRSSADGDDLHPLFCRGLPPGFPRNATYCAIARSGDAVAEEAARGARAGHDAAPESGDDVEEEEEYSGGEGGAAASRSSRRAPCLRCRPARGAAAASSALVHGRLHGPCRTCGAGARGGAGPQRTGKVRRSAHAAFALAEAADADAASRRYRRGAGGGGIGGRRGIASRLRSAGPADDCWLPPTAARTATAAVAAAVHVSPPSGDVGSGARRRSASEEAAPQRRLSTRAAAAPAPDPSVSELTVYLHTWRP